MRDALVNVLAQHANQPLTPAVARSILGMLFPDRTPDLSRFAVELWRGCLIQAEHFSGGEEMTGLEEAFYLEAGDQAFASSVDRERLRELERAGRLLSITARRDGRLIGLLRCFILNNHRTQQDEGRDDMFFILPTERGGMLAARMARYTEACLFAMGAKSATINVRLENGMGRIAKFMGYRAGLQQWRKRLVSNCAPDAKIQHLQPERDQ